jgi:hypothetical protein
MKITVNVISCILEPIEIVSRMGHIAIEFAEGRVKFELSPFSMRSY